MYTLNENNYYVIEFLRLPYENIEKYVMVPYSWIRDRLTPTSFLVSYPIEDPLKTRKRVLNNKKFRDKWRIFQAKIIYSSDFNDVCLWMTTINGQNEIGSWAEDVKKSSSDDSGYKQDECINKRHLCTDMNNNPIKQDKEPASNSGMENKSSASNANQPKMKDKSLKGPDEQKMGLASTTESRKRKSNGVKNIGDVSKYPKTSSVSQTDSQLLSKAEYSKQDLSPQNTQENMIRVGYSSQSCIPPEDLNQRDMPVLNPIDYLHQDETTTPQEHTQSAGQQSASLMTQSAQVCEQFHEILYPNTFDVQQQHSQAHRITKHTDMQQVNQITSSQSLQGPNTSTSFSYNILPQQNHQPSRAGEILRENPRNAGSLVQYVPEINYQTNHQPLGFPTGSLTYSQQFTCSQTLLTGGLSETAQLQGVTKTTKNLKTEKKNLPICVPQDPRSRALFTSRSNSLSGLKQPPTIRNVTLNSSSAVQNLPTQSRKTPVPSYTDQVLPNLQGYDPRRPTYMNNPYQRHEQTTSRNTPAVVSKPNSITHCCCSCKCSNGKQISPPVPGQSFQTVLKNQCFIKSGSSLHHAMATEETPVAALNKSNHHARNCPEHAVYSERTTASVKTIPSATNMSLDDKRMAEKMLTNEFNTLFAQMDASFPDGYGPFTGMRNTFYSYALKFQTVMEKVNHYCESRMEEFSSINRQATEGVTSSTTEPRDNAQQNGHNNDYNNGTTKPQRSFVLPAEYDPKTTRWTLRYREPAVSTVELIPHSRVYVEALGLATSKSTARDCKTLALLLMEEIFSISALRVCSLTAAAAKSIDLEGSDVRPILDEYALEIILDFVEQYGIRNRWYMFNAKHILLSMHRRIMDFRSIAMI